MPGLLSIPSTITIKRLYVYVDANNAPPPHLVRNAYCDVNGTPHRFYYWDGPPASAIGSVWSYGYSGSWTAPYSAVYYMSIQGGKGGTCITGGEVFDYWEGFPGYSTTTVVRLAKGAYVSFTVGAGGLSQGSYVEGQGYLSWPQNGGTTYMSGAVSMSAAGGGTGHYAGNNIHGGGIINGTPGSVYIRLQSE